PPAQALAASRGLPSGPSSRSTGLPSAPQPSSTRTLPVLSRMISASASTTGCGRTAAAFGLGFDFRRFMSLSPCEPGLRPRAPRLGGAGAPPAPPRRGGRGGPPRSRRPPAGAGGPRRPPPTPPPLPPPWPAPPGARPAGGHLDGGGGPGGLLQHRRQARAGAP